MIYVKFNIVPKVGDVLLERGGKAMWVVSEKKTDGWVFMYPEQNSGRRIQRGDTLQKIASRIMSEDSPIEPQMQGEPTRYTIINIKEKW